MAKPSGHHEMRGCKPDGPKNQWAKVLVAPTSGVIQRTERFIRRVGTARLEEMVKSTWYFDLRVGDKVMGFTWQFMQVRLKAKGKVPSSARG